MGQLLQSREVRKLEVFGKESDELSTDTSQEMVKKEILKKIYDKVEFLNFQHDDNINELWQINDLIREKRRDLGDRSRCDSLRVDGLK